jgi:hypothetical protein
VFPPWRVTSRIDAFAEILRSRIVGNGHNGIDVGNTASFEAEELIVSDNSWAGIRLYRAPGQLADLTISGNYYGLALRAGSVVDVRNGVVFSSNYIGITASDNSQVSQSPESTFTGNNEDMQTSRLWLPETPYAER